MGAVLLNLVPLEIGAAIVPLWVTLTLLVLRANNGFARSAAFAAGGMTMRLLQGALFGYVFRVEGSPAAADGSHAIVSLLLLLAGVVLLITFVRALYREEDPDAPPPAWLARLDTLPAPTLLGLGALLMAVSIKQWVFTLSAIAVIYDAEVGRARSVLAYLAFAVAAHALVLAPIIYGISLPDRGRTALEAAQRWLEGNSRGLTLGASLGFGLLFLWLGLTGVGAGGRSLPAEAPPALLDGPAREDDGARAPPDAGHPNGARENEHHPPPPPRGDAVEP